MLPYFEKNRTVCQRKYDRISKQKGPYLETNRTVSRRKCYRISEEIRPYVEKKGRQDHQSMMKIFKNTLRVMLDLDDFYQFKAAVRSTNQSFFWPDLVYVEVPVSFLWYKSCLKQVLPLVT